jgi:hypothetical protein
MNLGGNILFASAHPDGKLDAMRDHFEAQILLLVAS